MYLRVLNTMTDHNTTTADSAYPNLWVTASSSSFILGGPQMYIRASILMCVSKNTSSMEFENQ